MLTSARYKVCLNVTLESLLWSPMESLEWTILKESIWISRGYDCRDTIASVQLQVYNCKLKHVRLSALLLVLIGTLIRNFYQECAGVRSSCRGSF